MNAAKRKKLGAYYTPDQVVRSLVTWAVRSINDRMLDPSCGDGRFLVVHPNSVGVEQDPDTAQIIHEQAPGCLIHQGDFFAWAIETHERFECAAGNPPFIRYQSFTGDFRRSAQELCSRHGAHFSSLSSSWAPFIVGTATLLKPGGRMAFVVPAEIGHAPYASPVIEYLVSNFGHVQVVAVRNKLFPDLSEDCWLLYADGYGRTTDSIIFTPLENFQFSPKPPDMRVSMRIPIEDWRRWNKKLRAFLLSQEVRDLYQSTAASGLTLPLGEFARVGIGYVSGANHFFHLRPSQVKQLGIPGSFLMPTIRNGRMLVRQAITRKVINEWHKKDDPFLFLCIQHGSDIPRPIRKYLESQAGVEARTGYKCRNREPWYVVPDVSVPDAFLSYMSGAEPKLALNDAGCVATNSVHVVRLTNGVNKKDLLKSWDQPLTQLSCEIEGHPLGGGMLKIEPREAARIRLPRVPIDTRESKELITSGIKQLRSWRHYGGASGRL